MKKILIVLFSLIPYAVFAASGDTTFDEITNKITAYLTGSLGLVFVLVGFLGAAAAMAGFASMKVMFPVFGLTLALHYGPGILKTIFGSDGNSFQIYQSGEFSITDIIILLVATRMFIVAIFGNRKKVETK